MTHEWMTWQVTKSSSSDVPFSLVRRRRYLVLGLSHLGW